MHNFLKNVFVQYVQLFLHKHLLFGLQQLIYLKFKFFFFIIFVQTPFSKDARGVLDETRTEKKNFLRIRIFDINTFSSELAKKYNFQVIDLHYLVRKSVQHRCKDGMHYDALVHRQITTHIAHYISCGFNKNLSEYKIEDNDLLCYDIIKSIINKIDYQITSCDKKILEEYRPLKMNFDLNEKEKQLLYLIDYYENNS